VKHLKRIRFVRNTLPYTIGETAAFADHEADRLVKAGYGEFVVSDPAPAPIVEPAAPAAAEPKAKAPR
jgi:hypothetical protein